MKKRILSYALIASLGIFAIDFPAAAVNTTYAFIATLATSLRTVQDRFADQYNAKDWGVKADVNVLTDLAVTAANSVVTSPSYCFVAADVSAPITIKGVGVATGAMVTNNGTLNTTISSVSSCAATLAANPTYSVASATAFVGGTDDTTAWNAAELAVHNMHKGSGIMSPQSKIIFKGTSRISGTITLYRDTTTEGNGNGNTNIIITPGSNIIGFMSENFNALTGTGLNYGVDARVPSNITLRHIYMDGMSTRDGTAGGNTSGGCIALYGNAMTLDDVAWTNCAATVAAVQTEASGSYVYSLYDTRANEECYFNNLYARENAGISWQHKGCHDTHLTSYTCAGGATWCLKTLGSGTTYQGSFHADYIHTFFEDDGHGVDLGYYYTIARAYIDTDSWTVESTAANGVIGTINQLGGGAHGLDPLILNAQTTIGSFTGGLGSSAVAGQHVIYDASAYGVIIGNANIDLTAQNIVQTGIYMHGTYSTIGHANINGGGSANKIGVDLSGSSNHVNVICDPIYACINYTAGFGNNMEVGGYFNAGNFPLVGSLASNDTYISTGVGGVSPQEVFGGNLTAPGLTTSSTVDTIKAHIASAGAAPALSACGTTPALASGATDMKGFITIGTGVTTACTLTFNAAYGSAPICVATTNSTTVFPAVVSTSATAINFGLSASFPGGGLYYYCVQ